MELVQQQLQTFSDGLAGLLTMANLQIGLLIGSGLLAISLLTLALTRWGHSRPVWKCVILSFIAHILLMGYGYGTYLISDQPAASIVAEPMRVNLVEDVGQSLADVPLVADSFGQPQNQLQKSAEQSWDRLANQSIELPSHEPLERPMIDSELVIERVSAAVDAATAVRLPDPLSGFELPDELAPLVDNLTAKDLAEANAFSRNELPGEELSEESLPELSADWDVAAQAIEMKRRGGDANELSDSVPPVDAISEIDELERPEPDANTADMLATFRNSTAIPDANNKSQPFAGELQSGESNVKFGGASREKLIRLKSPLAKMDSKPALQAGPSQGRIRVIHRPRRLGDGSPMPQIYSLRTSENRLAVAQQRGGSIKTEQAVEAGLRWLADHQHTDGHWDAEQTGAGRETRTFGHDRNGAGADADCGITGLATLAFLAAGHSHFEGPYQRNVQLALEYLAGQQERDGNLAGESKMFARMYCHSMALLAVSEALAMTGDDRLLPVVQRATDYSLASQNKQDGGWRYQPGDAGDMSQFGWMALALNSAKLGGAHVPAATFERMKQFVDACSSGHGNGLAAYRPGQGPSTAMTAEALLCRYLLNHGVTPATRATAVQRVSQELPSAQKTNLYYWYYGTLAMRHVGGDAWAGWNNRLKTTLVSLQNTSGTDAGSWDPSGVWGGYGGRVYSTAVATLNLEVYYRYLPTHEMADSIARESTGGVRR